MHSGTILDLKQPNSTTITTNHEGKELGKWITKYAPLNYEVKCLSFEQVYNCLDKQGLILNFI